MFIDIQSPKAGPFPADKSFEITFPTVPSLISIFQHMFAQESSKSSSVTADTATRAGFLHEGLLIQDAQ